MKTIGFIGIGVMGKSMARNLRKAGFDVAVYTRTKAKAQDIIDEGALWCDSVKECTQGKDAVITMVGYPQDVEEVYFGEAGIIASAEPGAYLIDMTTTSPRLAQRIFAAAKEKGLRALDAPVTGGDTGAKAGTLSILAGGEKADFDACLPLFNAMGTNICYTGGAGCGQHTKMANQVAIAGTLAGACEALVYAKNVGLDPEQTLNFISEGAAKSTQMTNVAARALENDYAPGFFLKHFIKDMNIASGEMGERNLRLDVLDLVLKLCRELEAKGLGDEGTQAIIKHYPW